MRLTAGLPAGVLVWTSLLAGCAGLSVSGGIPILPKPQSGLLISAVEGPPDIERGKQARIEGRLSDAERDLLPLATRGYPDAQLYLAQTYSQSEQLTANDESIRWFRAALAQRPEADIGLARALMRSGKRGSEVEVESLLNKAERDRGDPAVPAARLEFYARYPELGAYDRGDELAARLRGSELAVERAAAISWYRTTITRGDNAQRLAELCVKYLEVDLSCTTDLAHFYRYTGNREALEAHIDRSLKVFQRARLPSADRERPLSDSEIGQQAGALAQAMVDQPDDINAAEAVVNYAAHPEVDPELEAEVANALKTGSREDAVSVAQRGLGQLNGIVTLPELADKVLRWMLKQGSDYAFEAEAVAVGYPFLLRDIDLEGSLKAHLDAGRVRANLALGELYLFGLRADLVPEKAEHYLLEARKYRSTRVSANYRLGRVYIRGLLGSPAPQLAIERLLESAREGSTASYGMLAEMFFTAHGVKIDRVNAMVFARRAEDSGRPLILRSRVVSQDTRVGTAGTASANANANPNAAATTSAAQYVNYNLVERLKAEMSPQELQEADARYEAERAVLPYIRPPVTPDIWNRVKL